MIELTACTLCWSLQCAVRVREASMPAYYYQSRLCCMLVTGHSRTHVCKVASKSDTFPLRAVLRSSMLCDCQHVVKSCAAWGTIMPMWANFTHQTQAAPYLWHLNVKLFCCFGSSHWHAALPSIEPIAYPLPSGKHATQRVWALSMECVSLAGCRGCCKLYTCVYMRVEVLHQQVHAK